MSRKPNSRRLMVESLESRALMAGDVTAAVIDGKLQIHGDDFGNQVQIRQLNQTFEGEWPGVKLEISGKNLSGQQTTTINGEAAPLIVEGVKSGAAIFLGTGDNTLRIGTIPRDSSTQNTTAVALSGTVNIGTGNGADEIRLYLVNGSQVNVNARGGEDFIQIQKSRLNRLTVNSDVVPAEGEMPFGAKDRVWISGTKARGAVSITSGVGDDNVDLRGASSFTGRLDVHLGEGADLFLLAGFSTTSVLSLSGETNVLGGGGNDSVTFSSVLVQEAFFADLGSGADSLIGIHLSSTVSLAADFGIDNDRASFLSVDIFGVDFDGGTGFDEIQRGDDTNLGTESLDSFESDENF